jgi:hypothetical protein
MAPAPFACLRACRERRRYVPPCLSIHYRISPLTKLLTIAYNYYR